MTTRFCNDAERLTDLKSVVIHDHYTSLVVDNQIQYTMYISLEQMRNKAELSWCTLFNMFLYLHFHCKS